MAESIDVRVMCFANGGENFDSTSCNTYVLDGAAKYEVFRKYFLTLLRDDFKTKTPSAELIRVRIVLYAAGQAGTDDWQVFNYQITKEDFKQLERNIVIGLLELGSFDEAEMVGIAIGKRPAKRISRNLSKGVTVDTDEDLVDDKTRGKGKRRGLVIEN